MTYRAIQPAEIPQWRAFEEYCFRIKPADFDVWMATLFRIENVRAYFGRSGEMLAALTLFPFAVYMDGRRMAMGGIGGVASVPENRRGGYVGQALVGSLAEMKERQMPISTLYPFKQAFYRRYGWEVAAARVEHKIPLDLLAGYRKAGGVVRRYLPGQPPVELLEQVYGAWAAPQRGRLVRESDWHWTAFIARAAYHTAVWHPEAGAAPEGYLIYRLDEDRLHVHDFVAATRAAERALLGYMANHDSQVKFALLRTGREYPLWHLVDDTYPVESKLHAGWQLRLVDLQAAFEGRPWPADVRGSLTMQVADEHAPWNAGTWRVTFEGGAAVVRRAPGAVAGLAATVQTWAQLYAGFVRPEVALANDRLAVADRSGMELLGQALRGPGMDFTDPF
ncbi:MAG TPA: GNAT family N-acetyltransferase [Symbiobacteriaceae bacterium]|nr:GNAT family N-acetyltransferase [Symbiobacteriaceae bacterium]